MNTMAVWKHPPLQGRRRPHDRSCRLSRQGRTWGWLRRIRRCRAGTREGGMTANLKHTAVRRAVVELIGLERILEGTLGWPTGSAADGEVGEALRRVGRRPRSTALRLRP